MQALSDARAAHAELNSLRERASRAWDELLAVYGETKSSCSSDTEFWAELQVNNL